MALIYFSISKPHLSYFSGVLAFFDIGQVRKRTPQGLLKLYFIVARYNNRILKAWLEYIPLYSHTKENQGRKILSFLLILSSLSGLSCYWQYQYVMTVAFLLQDLLHNPLQDATILVVYNVRSRSMYIVDLVKIM